MTYATLSDDIPEDPKFRALSDAAFRVYFDTRCHDAKHLNDGVMSPRDMVWILNGRPFSLVDEIVAQGIFAAEPNGVFRIVGIELTQLSRAEVEGKREKGAVRSMRQSKHRNGDHSMCQPKYCPDIRDDEKGVTRHATRHVTASRNDPPSHPIRKDGRDGESVAASGAGAPLASPAGHGGEEWSAEDIDAAELLDPRFTVEVESDPWPGTGHVEFVFSGADPRSNEWAADIFTDIEADLTLRGEMRDTARKHCGPGDDELCELVAIEEESRLALMAPREKAQEWSARVCEAINTRAAELTSDPDEMEH